MLGGIHDWQELVTLAVAAGAFLYVIRRLVGPREKRAPAVQIGGRLARGLAATKRGRRPRS